MPNGMARGLTLLEILTTMAVGAILFGIAVPGMANLIEQNRLTTHVNNLRASLSLTRSHAVHENTHAVICKSADGLSCIREGKWTQGWIVFADDDRNRRRSEDERLLQVNQAISTNTQIEYRAFGSRHYVTYRPSGMTRTNGTFYVCNPKAPKRSKALILRKSGRIRLSDTRADGKPIKCGDKP